MDLENIGIALLALACGWLGSLAQSYFSEKGKNLATKEDIQEITAKVEFVKNQFTKQHLRSKAYIERQILAYDTICQFLQKTKKSIYDPLPDIEFINQCGTTQCKATYAMSEGLMTLLDERQIYISPYVHSTVTDIIEALFLLSETRYSALQLKDSEAAHKVLEECSNITNLIEDTELQIRKELIDE